MTPPQDLTTTTTMNGQTHDSPPPSPATTLNGNHDGTTASSFSSFTSFSSSSSILLETPTTTTTTTTTPTTTTAAAAAIATTTETTRIEDLLLSSVDQQVQENGGVETVNENGNVVEKIIIPMSECERLYGPYPASVPVPFLHVRNEGREGITPPPPPPVTTVTPSASAEKTNKNDAASSSPPPNHQKNEEGMMDTPPVVDVVCDVRDAGTPDQWIVRDGTLVRLTGKHPFNCEPPLATLHAHRFLTPSSLHYVRNHGACPKLDWHTHQLHVSSRFSSHHHNDSTTTLTYSMDALLALPAQMHRELPVTLVCAGNRRKEQNMIRQTIGFNWGPAGVGTMVYKGILLRELLLLLMMNKQQVNGLMPSSQYHVEFVGVEDLPNKVGIGPFPDDEPWGKLVKYGTSIPLAKALNPANDILLAYQANGAPLAPDHGYPLRLVIPGYIGGRMIKWLQHIRVIPHETRNHYHYHDNRILPPHITAEESVRQGWWYKPEYIFNELNINSAIAKPDHGETLLLASSHPLNQNYTVSGYAYTGGGRAITRVEVSVDGGVHWELANLDRTERPTPHGMYWCWTWWDYTVPVSALLRAQQICCRAWDAANNCQNDTPTWNLMGMGNNQVFRVHIHLDHIIGKDNNNKNHHHEPVLRFEHPTQPGQQTGGWMTRLADKPVSAGFGKLLQVMHEDDNEENVPPAPAAATTKDDDDKNKKKTFTLHEVEQHNQEHDVWIIVKNRVYDCTEYLELHPGGIDSIIINAGADATEDFVAIHSTKATKMLEKYYIGDLDRTTTPTPTSTTTSTTDQGRGGGGGGGGLVDADGNVLALNPKMKTPFRLQNKIVLSRDSFLLDFALPTPEHVLGLPTGKHLFLSAKIHDEVVLRRYTPISSNYDKGTVQFVIKAYPPCERFPEGGKMSQYLDRLAIGDYLDMRGPVGEFHYLKNGQYTIDGVPGVAKHFNMIAGGTGITPVMQIAAEILRHTKAAITTTSSTALVGDNHDNHHHHDDDHDKTDTTTMRLIFGAREEGDLLMRSTLDEWAATYPHAFQVHYILSDSWPSQWPYSTGFVDQALFAEYLFPPSPPPPTAGSESSSTHPMDLVMNLMCGPPIMIDKGCRPNLEALGHSKASMFSF